MDSGCRDALVEGYVGTIPTVDADYTSLEETGRYAVVGLFRAIRRNRISQVGCGGSLAPGPTTRAIQIWHHGRSDLSTALIRYTDSSHLCLAAEDRRIFQACRESLHVHGRNIDIIRRPGVTHVRR
jgi:hypothetical protein